jgi:hypothetical protein
MSNIETQESKQLSVNIYTKESKKFNKIDLIIIKNAYTNKLEIKIIRIPEPKELPLPPLKWLKDNN